MDALKNRKYEKGKGKGETGRGVEGLGGSVIFITKIKTRTRIIGLRFQKTRTRIIVIQKTKTK